MEPAFVPVVRILWKARVWIIAAAFLSAAAFGVYALVAPKIYQSAAVLAVVENDAGGGELASVLERVGGLAALAGVVDPGKQGDEAIFMLRSRTIGEEFIRSEGLLQEIFADKWDEDRQEWKVSAGDAPPTIQDAFRVFDTKIRSVFVDQKSGFVTVAIHWRDPVQARQWVTRLIEMVNQKMRQSDIAEATRSLEFLDQELQRTSILEIRQAMYRLVEAQTRRKMLANVREEYSFRIVDPPVVPDANKYESPRKVLLVLLGGVLGSLVSSFLVVVVRVRSSVRADAA